MNRRAKGKSSVIVFGTLLSVVLLGIGWFSWNHFRFWRLFESLGINEQGYPEYRHRQTGIVMVRVPGGTFMMGSPEDEDGAKENEHPQHEATLSPFLIGKYEVTQAQWEAVMGSNPSHFAGDDKRPVETVSWNAIQEFESLTRFVLPTEAQWEYACRAGQPGPYSGTGKIDDMGWYLDNSKNTIHPVGEKAPNPLTHSW